MGHFDHREWNAAAIRFCEFIRNLPVIVDEEDVATYDEIVGEFEQASGMNLSRFRASGQRVERGRDSKPGWQTGLPATLSRDHFVSTILEFTQYLRSSFSPPPCDGRPN